MAPQDEIPQPNEVFSEVREEDKDNMDFWLIRSKVILSYWIGNTLVEVVI